MADRHIDRAEAAAGLERAREQRDQMRAERGEALARLLRGEPVPRAFPDHLLPILEGLYVRYQRVMVQGEPGAMYALRFAEDFVAMLGGSVQLGEQAFRKLAARRLGVEVPEAS